MLSSPVVNKYQYLPSPDDSDPYQKNYGGYAPEEISRVQVQASQVISGNQSNQDSDRNVQLSQQLE